MTRSACSLALAIVMGVLLAVPAAAAPTTSYSGTLVAIDAQGGVLTVAEFD